MNWQCKFGIHCKHPQGQRTVETIYYQRPGCKKPLIQKCEVNVTMCCQCEQEWTYVPQYNAPWP